MCEPVAIHAQNAPFYCATASGYTIEQPYAHGISVTYKASNIANTFGPLQEDTWVIPAVLLTVHVLLQVGLLHHLLAMIITNLVVQASHRSSTTWYTTYPLWDGAGCHASSHCCDNDCKPWFWQSLPEIIGSDIKVR